MEVVERLLKVSGKRWYELSEQDKKFILEYGGLHDRVDFFEKYNDIQCVITLEEYEKRSFQPLFLNEKYAELANVRSLAVNLNGYFTIIDEGRDFIII
jgi:hypothetical protein